MEKEKKYSVLIVDDSTDSLKVLNKIFQDAGYKVFLADNGEGGLKILAKEDITLIIADYTMPTMTGVEFLEKSLKSKSNTIRFLITGHEDLEIAISAINHGRIHYYFQKPVSPKKIIKQTKMFLEELEAAKENETIKRLMDDNKDLLNISRALKKAVDQKTVQLKNDRELLIGNVRNLKKQIDQSITPSRVIWILHSLVEALDPSLARYMENCAQLSKKAGILLGLSAERVKALESAALIHDIAFLHIPRDLMKMEEQNMNLHQVELYHKHSDMVGDFLKKAKVEELDEIGRIVAFHHELINGKGPKKLFGDHIPLESQILGVVACYCKVVHFWPQEMDKIILRAKKYIGTAAAEISVNGISATLRDIAQRVVMHRGANREFALHIVLSVLQLAQEEHPIERIISLPIDELKEDMRISKDVKSSDGKIMVTSETVIDEALIEQLKKLHGEGVISNYVWVDGNLPPL